MKLFTRNVALATLAFCVVNGLKAAAFGFTPPIGDRPAMAQYLAVLVVMSLLYAWVFKLVWLKMDDYFESADGYVGPEWEE